MKIFPCSTKFLTDDGVPFILDPMDNVWTIRTFYDEYGVECDTIEEAVTAEVTCAKLVMTGVADLTRMNNPRIN